MGQGVGGGMGAVGEVVFPLEQTWMGDFGLNKGRWFEQRFLWNNF